VSDFKQSKLLKAVNLGVLKKLSETKAVFVTPSVKDSESIRNCGGVG